MIRSLPKRLRTRFVPIADTVAAVQESLRPGDEGLVQSLRRELSRIGGVAIPPDAFNPEAIPAHLHPRFRVTDQEGNVLTEGGDLAALKAELADDTRHTIAAGRHPLEQAGLTSWSIGELPQVIEVGEAGHRAPAYPALVDDGDSVSVRLLATPAEQDTAMRTGVCRLLLLTLPSPAGLLRPLMTTDSKRDIRIGPYESTADWADDCLMAATAQVVADSGGPPWDGTGFDRLHLAVRDRLAEIVTRVGSDSLGLLHTLGEIEWRLEPLTDRFPDAVDDVVAQVNRLVYPGFLEGIGAGRIADVSRYLQAVVRRLERLPEQPERDADLMARVHRLEVMHNRLSDLLPMSLDLIEVAWMLEELRVSLFAQALGTRGKVSEQRIERALADLEG